MGDRTHQAKVIKQAVEEWYSGSWAYGVRCTAADRERLVWTLTRRLGLQAPETTPASSSPPAGRQEAPT